MAEEENAVFLNFRDVGGFFNRDGCFVKNGCFFRSGMPLQTGETEKLFLKTHNIKTVIDFRSQAERRRENQWEKDFAECARLSIPYYDQAGVSSITRMEKIGAIDWPGIYMEIISRGQEWIRAVFLAFADAKPGVLFHCASGKDRTGVIAAVLLDLLAADDIWIVADYAQSQYHFQNITGFYETTPQTMAQFLKLFRMRYGSAWSYLRLVGVPETALLKLRIKMVNTWRRI